MQYVLTNSISRAHDPTEAIEPPGDLAVNVGTIGDAEVNASTYKLRLLQSERVIVSISNRNKQLQGELAALQSLLR